MSTRSSKRAIANRGSAEPQAAFEFLIGRWSCDVRVHQPDETVAALRADWRGMGILGGDAVLDEFTLWGIDGAPVMRGVNIRVFDRATQTWAMKWFNATEMRWWDLGPEELGGVCVLKTRIEFLMRYQANEIHRIAFSEISQERFRWSCDRTLDKGKTWSKDVMTIDARRV